MPVAQVGERLECGARFQQYAAEAVLVPGGAGDHVASLGCERPGRLEGLVGLGDRQQRVGDAQRRLRDDEGVALVGLGVAREQPSGLVRGEPGQVRDAQPRQPRARDCQQANVATLVDDNDRIACDLGKQAVEIAFRVADAPVERDLSLARDEACPVRRLADVDAQNGLGWGYCGWHGGILPIVGRSECCFPRHPHYMAVAHLGGRPGSFLSVVGNSGARVGNTPRALLGQGRKAVRGRPIGSPSGLASIVVRFAIDCSNRRTSCFLL